MSEAEFFTQSKKFESAQTKLSGGTAVQDQPSPPANSAAHHQTNSAKPKATAFDVEALPTVLRTFAQELANSLPVAVDLPAVASLVVAGAAIGGSRSIQLKPGWTEHAGLYAALVAPTGGLKTPALQKVVAPLAMIQSELAAAHEMKLRAYEDFDLTKYRAALKQFEQGHTTEPPVKPAPPIHQRTFTSDTTVERLAGLLSENPMGLLIVRDELSAWVASMNQYRGGRGADRQFFLSAYSAARLVVDRQGKPPLIVDRPFLSIIGNIPPDVLPELSHEASREEGTIYRLIFAFPASVSVRWREAEVSATTATKYETLIRSLFAFRTGEAKTLSLAGDARGFFQKWHDEHCAAMESPALTPGLRGFYAKYKGTCARLALIHALAENPNAEAIPLASVAAACDLTDYFREQAAKILPLLPRHSTASPVERCEREILRNLAGGAVLTDRELQRNGNAPAVVFREVLKSLTAVGRIVKAFKPGEKGPRKANRLANEDET